MKFQAFHVNPGEKLKKKDVNNDLSNFMSVFPIIYPFLAHCKSVLVVISLVLVPALDLIEKILCQSLICSMGGRRPRRRASLPKTKF